MRLLTFIGACFLLFMIISSHASAELFVAEEFRYKAVSAPDNIGGDPNGTPNPGYGSYTNDTYNNHTGLGFNSDDATGFSNAANLPGTEQNLWTSDNGGGANGFHRFQAGFGLGAEPESPNFDVFGDLTNYEGTALRGCHLKRSSFTGASSAYRGFETTDGTAASVVAVDSTVYMSVLMEPENTNSNSWFGLSSAGDLNEAAGSPQFVDDTTQDNAYGFRLFAPQTGGTNEVDGVIEGLRMTDGTAVGSGTFTTRSSSTSTDERLYFTADEKFMLILEYTWGSSSDILNIYKIEEADADLATSNGGNLYADLSGFDSLTMSVNFNQNQLTGISAWDNANTQTAQVYIGSDPSDVAPGLFVAPPAGPVIEITGATGGGTVTSPGFTFGTWDTQPAVYDILGDSIIINDNYDFGSTPSNGGAGYNGGGVDFDASTHALEIEASLLFDNAADRFRVLLSDEDGDDSGPGLGTEDYIYFVETSNFGSDPNNPTTRTIPLGDGTADGIQNQFGSVNSGDGIQNFDLDRIAVQSLAFTAGDFNQDGRVDGQDFLEWQRDPSVGDLADWEADYGSLSFNGKLAIDIASIRIVELPSSVPAVSAVPEPASAVLLLTMSFGLLTRRRI